MPKAQQRLSQLRFESGLRCKLTAPSLFAPITVLLWFTSLLRRWTRSINEELGPNGATHDVIFDGVQPKA